ncbi:MAG: tripartite tricarboxylate transporter TctB family protein [Limnochordia bacterium]|jgi:hypothetical protein
MWRNRLAIASMFGSGILIYLGTRSYPAAHNASADPALFPRAIAVLLIIMGLVAVYQEYTGKTEGTEALDRHYLKITALFAGGILLYNWIGLVQRAFFLSTFIFLGAMAYLLGERPLVRVGAYSIGLTLSIYIVFVVLLRVPL